MLESFEGGPFSASLTAMTTSASARPARASESYPDDAAAPATAPIAVNDSTGRRRARGARSKAPLAPPAPTMKVAIGADRRSSSPRVPSTTQREQFKSSSRQVETLLIGVGLGAAVTLSIVMLRTKNARSSPVTAALVKFASYAVGRTSPRGSLTRLLARAVGNALA